MEAAAPEGEAKGVAQISCCLCGLKIVPNQANMCVPCLRNQVDITEDITKTGTLLQCQTCMRYNAVGTERWLKCELESADLLALCLKAIHGLGRGKGKKSPLQMIDASFIWTEPHSRRVKVQVTVERDLENFNMITIRQRCVVEFTIKNRMCPYCSKENTNTQWTTLVQIRQQVKYKRTLLNLENKLLRNEAAKLALQVIVLPSGLDFYFVNLNDAKKFSDHVVSLVPSRRKESKSLTGADLKSNKYRFKVHLHIEVAPICKNDFVALPKKLQNQLFGGQVPFALVESVSSSINLIEPHTMRRAKLTGVKYWQNEFKSLVTAREMVEFIVLDVQPLDYAADAEANGTLAEVEVARASDFGVNDERETVVSHIGKHLSPGDTVLGYDFATFQGETTNGKAELPPVVLVQKVMPKSDKGLQKKKKKKENKRKQAAGPPVEYELDDGDDLIVDDGSDEDFDFDEDEYAIDDGIDGALESDEDHGVDEGGPVPTDEAVAVSEVDSLAEKVADVGIASAADASAVPDADALEPPGPPATSQ